MAFDKEQRESERFPVNDTTRCVLAAPITSELGPVRIKNISSNGIGILASQTVDVGSLLAVMLTNPAKNIVRTMLVHVTHATPQPGNTFLIGGSFDTPLTYEELCQFVM